MLAWNLYPGRGKIALSGMKIPGFFAERDRGANFESCELLRCGLPGRLEKSPPRLRLAENIGKLVFDAFPCLDYAQKKSFFIFFSPSG